MRLPLADILLEVCVEDATGLGAALRGGAGRIETERSLSVNIPSGVETGTRIRLAFPGVRVRQRPAPLEVSAVPAVAP